MTRPGKVRLDQLLVDRGLAESRSRAQALILAGQVRLGDSRALKAGQLVAADAEIALDLPDHPYVSRGGLKLAHALNAFGLDPAGLRCLDIGASTGGFTDCLLQRGARAVVAVDVGTNQLAWKLRQDPRVTVLEQTHAKDLSLGLIGGVPVDWIVMDVSFISQRLLIPVLPPLLAAEGHMLALIKPQFEAGKGEAPKGVVKDPAVWARTIREVAAVYGQHGLPVLGLVCAEPRGPEGNREFFVHCVPAGHPVSLESLIETAITQASL